MKITIEGTDEQKGKSVSVEVPDDHLAMPSVVEDLLTPVLLAWGFHPQTVKETFAGDEE